jgi:hypothetical protein
MSAASPKQSLPSLGALRQDMRDADDRKIRQIVALLDGSPGNQVSQAVLDPLRPRLAALKPVRSLRFTRLLATPFDDLIVPVPVWRPGQATIPRSVLKSMTNIVRMELGNETKTIDQIIAGHTTDDTEVITRAGQALWVRAAEIMARSQQHAEWAETGLRPAACGPLALAIATVLRRASLLRCLLREAELGVLEPDEQAVREILSHMADEPPEGCTMVFKLVLGQLPHAVPLLRRLVDQNSIPAEKALLRQAMDRATGDLLDDMESRSDLVEGLRDRSLADVGSEVRRIAGLLQGINQDVSAVRHRAKVSGIREKLDAVCRGRFVDGMETDLVGPLAAATAAVDTAGQKQMETCARDLRTIETAGRKLGDPAAYDTLLFKASEAVQAAAGSGNLGTMRAVRLVEILSGPEMAEEMYKAAMNKQAAAPGSRVG